MISVALDGLTDSTNPKHSRKRNAWHQGRRLQASDRKLAKARPFRVPRVHLDFLASSASLPFTV